MKSDKSLDILKRIILTIILFAVYILIINILDRIFLTEEWSERIRVSMIFTVIYNLIAKRFLNLDYEKAEDYMWSFVVFALANIIYCCIVPMPQEEWGWFGSTFVRIWLCFQLFLMYMFGNGLYILICFVMRSIRNKMYGDILKRVLSAVIGFPLYFLAALVPILSWVEWIQIDYVADVAIYLFFAFVAGAVTGVFHFISGRLIKVSYEKMQDHVIFLLFFGIGAILCSTLNSTIGVIKEDFVSDSILLFSVRALFIYIIGNLVYFIWCNEKKRRKMKKRRKRSIDGGCNEEESKGIDEDLNEDEHEIGNVSSEIILIPGIDEDMEEGKNDSFS